MPGDCVAQVEQSSAASSEGTAENMGCPPRARSTCGEHGTALDLGCTGKAHKQILLLFLNFKSVFYNI